MTISEPEAAAIYTARYLSEKPKTRNVLKVSANQINPLSFLFLIKVQRNQCFVLCDAGGGTVVSRDYIRIVQND
jgi:3-oxoacyl-[acyl-carrier-protein] synthase III